MLHALRVRVLDLLEHLAVDAGKHLHEPFERTELLELLHGGEEVLQVHSLLPDLLLHPPRDVLVERALRLLDERDDVALLEDPARHAVGMEVLERVRLLTDADVLDRLLEHAVDRERRTAARIAIHLREDDAGDVEPRVEALGDLDRVLARHAVGDEEDLVGPDGGLEPLQLAHHLVVDLQPARGIHEHDAIARAARLIDAVARDLHHVLMPALGVHRDVELLTERLELVDRGWPVDVRGDEARLTALCLELSRELGRGRRLSRTLEPDHHHDGGRDRAQLQPFATLAEHRRELVIDDLHQLLGGRDRLELTDADCLLLDALEELAGQGEVDVGLEEDATYFTQPVLDVRFGEDTTAAQAREGGLEFLGKLIEHSLEA